MGELLFAIKDLAGARLPLTGFLPAACSSERGQAGTMVASSATPRCDLSPQWAQDAPGQPDGQRNGSLVSEHARIASASQLTVMKFAPEWFRMMMFYATRASSIHPQRLPLR